MPHRVRLPLHCPGRSLRGLGLLALPFLAHPLSAAMPALADAVERQDAAAIRRLLADPAAAAPQADGTTALHWAARHDDLATARALLAAGADANAVNRYGLSPLALAATDGWKSPSTRRLRETTAASFVKIFGRFFGLVTS